MNLRKTIFILPNLFTASSLFCGVYAIMRCASTEVTNDDVYRSSLLLFYAFLFDLFDGRVARMTKTQSAFGVEFDSLADLISFGIAPAIIAYRWSLEDAGIIGVCIAFLYVLGGAIRLARFNVLAHSAVKKKKAPGKYMMGLPIPVAAAFIVAFVVASRAMKDGEWPWLTSHGFTVNGMGYPMISIFMVVLAFLMVSTVRFRSFKDFKIKSLFAIIMLSTVIVTSAVLWIWYSPAYILIGLLLMYVTMGFIESIVSLAKRESA
ncbi:MAG: CDP-diacylglycerol--serine O-phosphatidyltransferase [Deltaproteobacteria bacterium]|nr:CDP-diacylglycerol--serine O-phosphatidyltransferase [Deltaproteobacteria bacterium]MBN2671075.1 CDP-diacylglycerol--serine O-phosphatidyltransferase [Deltaproteobacteria bacterium]